MRDFSFHSLDGRSAARRWGFAKTGYPFGGSYSKDYRSYQDSLLGVPIRTIVVWGHIEGAPVFVNPHINQAASQPPRADSTQHQTSEACGTGHTVILEYNSAQDSQPSHIQAGSMR